MLYALTKNSQLSTPAKAKVKKHLECENPLEAVKDGMYFCPHCFKVGYSVAKQK